MGCPCARASPVARVGSTPLPDALNVRGTGEVIAVAWLLEPAVLTGGLAGLAARRRGAVALAPGAARVGHKEGLTVLALAFGQWTSPPPNHRKIRAWKEENGAEKAGQRRVKTTEGGDKYYLWGRRRNGLTNNFNLTI